MQQYRELLKRRYIENTQPNDDIIDKFKGIDPFLHFLVRSIFKRSTDDSCYHSLDIRIIKFIIAQEFEIFIECEHVEFQHGNAEQILYLLLILEIKHPKLYRVAPDYVNKLIRSCSNDFLMTTVSKDKISCINNSIFNFLNFSEDGLAYDYKILLDSREYEYDKRLKKMSSSKIKILRLFNFALENDEDLVRDILIIYPEFNYHKVCIAKNRCKIFDGTELPQTPEVQRCYLYCMKYHLDSLFTDKGIISYQEKISYIKNLDALYKLMFVESNILTLDFCIKILNAILHDNIMVAELIIRRKFEVCFIDVIVDHVPLFSSVYQLSLKLYGNTRDEFYKILAHKLAIKHPVLRNKN